MVSLYVEVASDLLERAEYLELVRVHRVESLGKGEVRQDVLVALESLVQNGYRTLDDGAVLEAVYVTRVDLRDTWTSFWAGTLAWNALTVVSPLLRWTRSNAGTVVLQKMLRTLSDASCPVRVFAVWIWLPRISCRVVPESYNK